MHRRTFLHAVGASSLLALFPFSSLTTGRARRGREEAPLPGLFRCDSCGEWRGRVGAKTAFCRCEPSQCSKCGQIVHPHRICGHYWCEERRALIHIPWFVGMGHQCGS